MSSPRILLAEDNSDHQALLSLAISDACPDARILVVASPGAFLSAVRASAYDAVVLDYNLALGRADRLILEAGDALDGVPVVVVSSSEDQAVAVSSFRTGVADFMPKSEALVPDRLWARIRSAIERVRLETRERRKSLRRERTLVKLAETDALTGLPNRRAAERWLNASRTRHDRRRQSACVMVDIDHFKSINDRYGHDGGDRVICRLAGIIRSMLGPGDQAVRWGGEEFLILKSSSGHVPTWLWAEGLREAFEGAVIEVGGQQVRATLSAGVSVVPTSELGDQAVTLADHALYLAKDRGRNRVCTWEMVRFDRIAQDVALAAPGDDEALRERFMLQCSRELGPVQLEHLTKHSEAVAVLASRIAQRIRVAPGFQSSVRTAALLHDIGKCLVPESLLSKSGPLSDPERHILRQHAEQGAALAETMGVRAEVVEGIRNHHRRYDSKSEDRLATLPDLASSIIAVADALVTMTSDRPYRPAISTELALLELSRHSGGQFHPVAVEAAGDLCRDPKTRAASEGNGAEHAEQSRRAA